MPVTQQFQNARTCALEDMDGKVPSNTTCHGHNWNDPNVHHKKNGCINNPWLQSYHGILHHNGTEWITATHKMTESHRHNIEEKRPCTKECILQISILTTSKAENTNYSNSGYLGGKTEKMQRRYRYVIQNCSYI